MNGRILSRTILGAVLAWQSFEPALAGKADDTLVWANEVENPIADVNFQNTRINLVLTHLVNDHLTYSGSGDLKPALATKWSWVDDKTLEFDLRPDVMFHNGKKFGAEDVVYTFQFSLDRANSVLNYGYLSWIKSVDAVGPLKVRFSLHAPFPAALLYLANMGRILPKGHYDAAPAKADGKKDFGAIVPVGTGPYRIREVKGGESVRLERFDGHYQGSPKGVPAIRNILIRTVKDENTRLAELMTGKIDWVFEISKDQSERLALASQLTQKTERTMRFAYIAFDVKGSSGQKAFMDKRVRQAVSHAINRASLVQNLVGAPSEVVHAACHPVQFGCTSEVARYTFDPEKAKQLLADAGYPQGFEFELLAFGERAYIEAVIGDLSKVGLRAKYSPLQYAAILQKVHQGGAPVLFGHWGSASLPDALASTGHFFIGGPDDMAKDDAVTAAIKAANSELDTEKRKQLWSVPLRRIADEAYWLPMFTYTRRYVFNKDLDFAPTPDEIPHFYRARWK